MDFSISEDHQAIAELADQIFTGQVPDEFHPAFEASGQDFDQALWQTIAEAGLLGICFDESVGGLDMGFLAFTDVLKAQGKVLGPVPLTHSVVWAGMPLAKYGSDAQREQLVAPMIAGECHLSAWLPDTASAAIPLTAERSGDGWKLQGRAIAVPYAAGAKAILVPATTDEGLKWFTLSPEQSGVSLHEQVSTSGQPQPSLQLDGVEVGDDASLSGDGAEILEWILQRAYTANAAVQLGVVSEGLRRTAEYVGERKQFGKVIASFQAVSHRAANGYIDYEGMRGVIWQAAWLIDEGLDARGESRAAKWWSGEVGHRIGHTGQHLHGGIGADLEYPIHRYYLWTKQQEFSLGCGPQLLADYGQILASEG